ncbi:hypothetical protein [Schaalia georgiae]|uniref:hypothetical protein n=1 Tax=Schaalia georgiae TaxID=52768 RepID=UPI0013F3C960|nr:hypothetical protein [Schaalia georgiae]
MSTGSTCSASRRTAAQSASASARLAFTSPYSACNKANCASIAEDCSHASDHDNPS